jgi:hypothetical protein
VDARLFWKALIVQAICVAIPFVALALLLPDDFFEDYGWIVGPLVWLGCSAITARVIRQPVPIALFSAVAGGIAGLIVFLVASHLPGMIVALLVFAASSGSYEAAAEQAA